MGREALEVLQSGVGAQPVGACLKLRIEKPQPQPMRVREWLRGAPYQGPKNSWAANMGKVAKAEDP